MNRRDDLENAVGFDDYVMTLMEMLNHEDQRTDKPMFISIVGTSGAGKNTLARIISGMMTSDTKIVVWYSMEPSSSKREVLAEVHARVASKLANQGQCLPEEKFISLDMGDKIRRLLARGKYLLILEGISSKTSLNFLRASLPDDDGYGGGQVMLILDTENEEVGLHANTMNKDCINGVHLLTSLDRARSWELFCWKVFRKGEYTLSHEKGINSREEQKDKQAAFKQRREEPEEEEEEQPVALKIKNEEKETGEEEADRDLQERLVHETTRGYPMAIVLLAGLLRFKENPVQWNAVLQQLKSASNRSIQDGGGEGLPNGQITSNQLCNDTRFAKETVFWACFDDLPNDLKSCILYFAGYPNNYSHSTDTVVHMWIAEGFIRTHEGKTMEEVGYEYLKELVLRCLLEVQQIKADGSIQIVKIHRSLMGLLQSEVRESGFMEIHGIDEALVPSSVHRLFIHGDKGTRYATFARKKFNKLHSFICLVDDNKGDAKEDLQFLRWSKFLRVMSIQGLMFHDLPDDLGDMMVYLRYLRIDCLDLFCLPSSISWLLNLETLDISNTFVQVIDQNFWKIKTLRHVLASNLTLPTRTMLLEEGELQTLHGVKLDDSLSAQWSIGNSPLDKMKNIRSLKMHGFKYGKHGHAFNAALGKMHLLAHLNLQGDEIPSCVFTDPSLRSLQTIVLRGTVKWDDIVQELILVDPHLHMVCDIIEELPMVDCDFRIVRPNLVLVKLNRQAISEMPRSIGNHLDGILIQEY